VPDGVWNLFSSWTDLDDYESLHHVIHKNKQCEAHWLVNLHKYAHRTDLLFDVFTSIKSLRFVFVRKIDVPRGWELHLFLKNHYGKNKHKSLSHSESLDKVCEDGDLDIVRAMVERTQVNLEKWDRYCWTPLHYATYNGHFPVVQYLCERGVDKEATDENVWTPLHKAAEEGHLPIVQYLCEQGVDKEARTTIDRTPLHKAASKGHLPVVKYLCEQGADKDARTGNNRTPLHIVAPRATSL
jgi:ankyrin repeat protein